MHDIRRVIDDLIELEATGFSSSDIPLWNGTGWSHPARGSSPWTRFVIVDVGGKGDFTKVKDACDYVTSQVPAVTTPWVIWVLSGWYDEADFIVPSFTTIRGFQPGVNVLPGPTMLSFSVNGGTSGAHITLNLYSHLMDLYLSGKTGSITGNKTFISLLSTSVLKDIDLSSGASVAGGFTYSVVETNTTGALHASGGRWHHGTNLTGVVMLNVRATASLRNMWLSQGSNGVGSIGVKVAAGKTLNLIHSRFNSIPSFAFATDIDNSAGGNVYVNNTPYSTASGTITHVDVATVTVPGMVKKMPVIADLSQTISNPPTQAEVQAISDKVDDLLAALRVAGILTT